jgi:integrase
VEITEFETSGDVVAVALLVHSANDAPCCPSQLRRMFRLAVLHKKLTSRPHVPLLEEDNAREGFFEAAEFEALATHLPAVVADAARFAFLTGWRKGEITSLEWRDVDTGAGTIRLRRAHSKNKKTRTLVLHGELLDVIRRRATLRRLECPFVFHRNGKALRSFRKAWQAACCAAGFKGRLFHDLRRSAVRNMVRAGVPQNVAMRISGHKTDSVFRRYDIVNDDDLAAALMLTQEYVERKRQELRA